MVNRLFANRSFACDKNATLVVLTLLLSQTLAGNMSLAVAQDAPRAEEILKAIRRHGQSTKSFVFEWKETPSAVSDDVIKRAIGTLNETTKSESPEQRLLGLETARMMVGGQQPGSYRLVVDASRMRTEWSTFEPSLKEPERVVPQEIVETFDGRVGKSLVAKSAGNYPRGRIASKNETNGLDFVGSLPIVLAFRGALWLERLGTGRAVAVEGVIDNDPVAVLTLSWDNRGGTYTLWCDPAMDYHVRRIESHVNSIVRTHYDISYSWDDVHQLWIPKGWNRLFTRPDGAIDVQKSSQVTSYKVAGDIPSSEFDQTFPPGTWVTDAVNNRSYIVLADGGQRVVTPAEQAAGLTYDEIVSSSSKLGLRAYWLLFLSAVAIPITVYCVYRRNRRRHAAGSLGSNC